MLDPDQVLARCRNTQLSSHFLAMPRSVQCQHVYSNNLVQIGNEAPLHEAGIRHRQVFMHEPLRVGERPQLLLALSSKVPQMRRKVVQVGFWHQWSLAPVGRLPDSTQAGDVMKERRLAAGGRELPGLMHWPGTVCRHGGMSGLTGRRARGTWPSHH